MTLARKLSMRSEACDTIWREIDFCIYSYFVTEPIWFRQTAGNNKKNILKQKMTRPLKD